MALPRRNPDWCPECFRAVRGFGTIICPECGEVSPTAGYAGLAAKRRAQPARRKKTSKYSFGRAA
jgi:hypothetical protein